MHASPPHTNNFTRWFALGVESNAWSLVFLSNALTTAVLIGVWLGITLYSQLPSSGDSLDVYNPAFDAFPVPSSQQTYLQLSTSVYGRLGILLPLLCFYLVGWRLPHKRLARGVDGIVALLFLLTVALLITLVLARQSFNQQRQNFTEPRDTSVDASFTKFYCQARGAELCGLIMVIQPSQNTVPIEKLLTVFDGGAAGANEDVTNATLAMEKVVRGCLYIFAAQYDEHQEHLDIRSSLQKQQAFLRSHNTSDATDNWCGEYILTSALGVDSIGIRLNKEQLLDASPASVNSAVFGNFVRAWQSRFEFDVIMLGVAGIVLLLFCFSWIKMLASDKRPEVGKKQR